MLYGVTVQTLGRHDGDGIAVVFVDTNDPLSAEVEAPTIATERYLCEVIVDHPVDWSGAVTPPETPPD